MKKFHGRLVCDHCNHEEDTDDLVAARDAQCPRCGTPFMDDFDKNVLLAMVELAEAGVVVQNDDPAGIEVVLRTKELKRAVQ